ncbi:hypothetical protein MSP8886_02705 [Marinomonas spartinae]|uniref:Uncharacterized protein n=1 Tax=Marinomonas spartinae TaxID=1792290 RepID=A0A1A8TK43_9GAMM|nr:hypothetical protein [Marinomonas spartinae]SBS33286.1 hypothetical protein MSP8886_02705 [Marinomonas spartinae]
MNLTDLQTFFTAITVPDTNTAAVRAKTTLLGAITTYSGAPETAGAKFPSATNGGPTPYLSDVLTAFFIPSITPTGTTLFLNWKPFLADMQAIKTNIAGFPTKDCLEDLLSKIFNFAKAWVKTEATTLAGNIFSACDGYTGGQYSFLSGSTTTPATAQDVIQQWVEDNLFQSVWNWIGWLLNPATAWANWTTLFTNTAVPTAPAISSINITTNAGNYSLTELQNDLTCLNTALGGTTLWDPGLGQTVTTQIPAGATIHCYTVYDFASYIGALQEIGSGTGAPLQTNNVAHIIRIIDQTAFAALGNQQTQLDFSAAPTATNRGTLQDNACYVLLTNDSQYAYPLRIYGQHVADLWASITNLPYKHDYSALISFANNNISCAEVKSFLTTGKLPVKDSNELVPSPTSATYAASGSNQVMATALNTLTVLTANYMVEECRNWAQLLLGILQLERSATTFQHATQFPMAGGGWKNHWSWGNSLNPNRPAICNPAEDGRTIKRWFLNLFFTPTGQSFLALNKEDVVPAITVAIVQQQQPNLDQAFNNKVQATFKSAAKSLYNP